MIEKWGHLRVTLDDFIDAGLPQLCEVAWTGRVVDVASDHGVREAGFPSNYPQRVGYGDTQAKGAEWHSGGHEGVLCRSASMSRLGWNDWSGQHEGWSEAAIFVENAVQDPALVNRRRDLEWLLPDSLV